MMEEAKKELAELSRYLFLEIRKFEEKFDMLVIVEQTTGQEINNKMRTLDISCKAELVC